MTTPQLSHPMRRTIPSPAAVAITLSWTVFTLTPSFAVAETPETTVRPGKTSPEAMYRETPGVHTPADSPTTTVPADTAQLLFRAAASTGEGAIWHPGRRSLLWVDIEGKTLHEYVPTAFGKVSCGTGELMSGTKPAGSDTLRTVMTVPSVTRRWTFDRMVSTVVPETDSTVIVAVQNRVERIDLNSDTREVLARIDDRNGSVRTNDGKCDPQGRFWCGTSDLVKGEKRGKLYLLPGDGRCIEMLDRLEISNGLGFAGDTLYFIDSARHSVDSYRLDEDTLTLHDHRVIAPIEGNMVPDGMTMDEEGMLWVCHWGGGFVGRYDPRDGRLLARVEIPASQCSSCCFGGPDMQTLFITCGAVNCPEESEAGKVFAVHLPYRGVESWKYRG